MSEQQERANSIEARDAVIIDLDSVVTPGPDVLFTPLHDGQATLVHVQHKAQFSLNETGADIWRSFADGVPVKVVAAQLQERYEVERERAQASVLSLAQKLVTHGLCRVEPTAPE